MHATLLQLACEIERLTAYLDSLHDKAQRAAESEPHLSGRDSAHYMLGYTEAGCHSVAAEMRRIYRSLISEAERVAAMPVELLMPAEDVADECVEALGGSVIG